MALVALLIAVGLVAATLYALRGGLVGRGHVLTFAGFDANAALMGVLAVAAAVYFYSPIYGIALILSVMIHEFGHVAAFRVCGHSDARFRLIPLMGGVALSNQAPASQEKQFFITLMGPAICLAPMALCMALLEFEAVYSSPAVDLIWAFAVVTGSLNFFNLMPFWPLDGGRIVSVLLRTFLPGAVTQATMAMAAASIVLAIYSQSMLFLAFALMAAQNLVMRGDVGQVQRPMGKGRGALALAAYLATTAAFGLTGWPLLASFF